MKLHIDIIDAFTQTLFGGNQAAVVIHDCWLEADLMQQIATENNLAETAFVVEQAIGEYSIRWFSPITEIAFCGHATLAAAYVLFSKHTHLTSLNIYAEAVGKMRINRLDNNAIEMQFPNQKPWQLDAAPEALIKGLSIKPHKILQNTQAYFAIYKRERDVHNVVMDRDKIIKLAPLDVVVSAPANDFDFVSRYFWPANGGDEDAVTGSIHTGLAPFWAEHLGKNELFAHQASKRGGDIHCNVSADYVTITGFAVRYLSGQIHLPC